MTKIPNLVRVDPDSVLRCPSCGGAYLHQKSIDIFERHEDAQTGLHTYVEGGRVKVTKDLAGNPSPRRDGLVIRFACELCAYDVWLECYQHQGMTYMQWKV